jgi:predicted anti-sigma-YlaC factor YlaD
MTLTCKEVARLISEGLDRELPSEQQVRLRAHYAICRGCASLRDRLAFLRRAVSQVAERNSDRKD